MSDLTQVLNTVQQAIISDLTAINTTGSNIANVNTPNYSRLQPVFSTVGAAASGTNQEQDGVEITSVDRVYNKLSRTRSSSSSLTAGTQIRSMMPSTRFNPLSTRAAAAGVSTLCSASSGGHGTAFRRTQTTRLKGMLWSLRPRVWQQHSSSSPVSCSPFSRI